MYFKSQVHEWKNKEGFIHLLLLYIKWEQNQRDVEKSSFLRHFLSTIKSLKLMFKNAFFWDTF